MLNVSNKKAAGNNARPVILKAIMSGYNLISEIPLANNMSDVRK